MTLILILAVACLVFLWMKLKPQSHPPLPPGPPADPILGHLRTLPRDNQENIFYEWSKTYGGVMHLRVPGQSIIVLNTVQAAQDLLDKRSLNYSDRPKFVVFELMGWHPSLTFLQYGKLFQKHRRMVQAYLSPKKCETYQHIQLKAMKRLLRNLLTSPDDRETHLRRFSTTIAMQLAFGHNITSDNDPYVAVAKDNGFAMSSSGPPGSSHVDLMPILQYFPSWFPGTYYATQARMIRPIIERLQYYPFENVKQQMAQGSAKHSYLSYNLEKVNREGPESKVSVDDVESTAGVLYRAGADTTWSTLSIFMVAMVLHPEIQQRAQKELESVVGSERLPEFKDRTSLPFIECIVQESLRWYNAVPMGVPHRSMEDDVYNGMFIPKGSIIIANTRGMALDENVYSEPFKFNPARYLPKPAGNGEPYPVAQFGFGRRICPGRHLADASLFIAMASILSVFTITKSIGKDGMEITPIVELTSGLTSHPKPYYCTVRPRNEVALSIITQMITWDQDQDDDYA